MVYRVSFRGGGGGGVALGVGLSPQKFNDYLNVVNTPFILYENAPEMISGSFM